MSFKEIKKNVKDYLKSQGKTLQDKVIDKLIMDVQNAMTLEESERSNKVKEIFGMLRIHDSGIIKEVEKIIRGEKVIEKSEQKAIESAATEPESTELAPEAELFQKIAAKLSEMNVKDSLIEDVIKNLQSELKDIKEENADSKIKAVRDILSDGDIGITDLTAQNIVIQLIAGEDVKEEWLAEKSGPELEPAPELAPEPASEPTEPTSTEPTSTEPTPEAELLQKISAQLSGMNVQVSLTEDVIKNLQAELKDIKEENADSKIKAVRDILSDGDIGITDLTAQNIVIELIAGEDVKKEWLVAKDDPEQDVTPPEINPPKSIVEQISEWGKEKDVRFKDKPHMVENTVKGLVAQYLRVVGKKNVKESAIERAEDAIYDYLTKQGIAGIELQNEIIAIIMNGKSLIELELDEIDAVKKLDAARRAAREKLDEEAIVEDETTREAEVGEAPLNNRQELINSVTKYFEDKKLGIPKDVEKMVTITQKLVAHYLDKKSERNLGKLKNHLNEHGLTPDKYIEFINMVGDVSLTELDIDETTLETPSQELSVMPPNELAPQEQPLKFTDMMDALSIWRAMVGGGKFAYALFDMSVKDTVPQYLLKGAITLVVGIPGVVVMGAAAGVAKGTYKLVKAGGEKVQEYAKGTVQRNLLDAEVAVNEVSRNLERAQNKISAKIEAIKLPEDDPAYVSYLKFKNLEELNEVAIAGHVSELTYERAKEINGRDESFIKLISNTLYTKLQTQLGKDIDVVSALRAGYVAVADEPNKVCIAGREIELEKAEMDILEKMDRYFQMEPKSQDELFKKLEISPDGKIQLKAEYANSAADINAVKSMFDGAEQINQQVFMEYVNHSRKIQFINILCEDLICRVASQENKRLRGEIDKEKNKLPEKGTMATVVQAIKTSDLVGKNAADTVENRTKRTLRETLERLYGADERLMEAARGALMPGKTQEQSHLQPPQIIDADEPSI